MLTIPTAAGRDQGELTRDADVVVEAFTQLAPAYEETVDRELRFFWGVGYRAFLRRFIELAEIAEGEQVLDVATGTAYIPSQIVEALGRSGGVCGLDLTPAMLRRASERIAGEAGSERIHLVCASALAMPLAGGSYDTVLCGFGTHHIELPALLAEMRRVLRPGGKVVLADVAATPFWRSPAGAILIRVLLVLYGLALRSSRARAEVEAFGNVRTASEWRALLAANGFDRISLSEIRARYPWYPGGVILRARRAPASLQGGPRE